MKKITALILAAIMCVSLAACGGGTASSASTATGSSSTAQATTATEPVSGGTVNIPITDDPTTLQGWMLRNSNESVLSSAIYETLLQYDETGKPQPYLLESFEGDPESLTYTMVVKDGITFQDGTPLDAEAVKWNLDWYKENGVLTGSYFGKVESVEVVD